MKIVFCITRADTLGGAQIHVANLAAWLRARQHDALVVTGSEGPYCSHLASLGIPYEVASRLCRSIRPLADMSAVLQLRSIFRRQAPDVVSLHSSKAGLVGRLALAGCGIPVIFTAHGWSFTEGVEPGRAMLFRALERLVAPLADRIITVSEFDRGQALKAGIGTEKQVVTVHNAMPETPYRAEPSVGHGPVRIVMVARLDEPKDHRTLFQALSAMKEADWLLDLVGDGPREQELRNAAGQLGIADRVRFLGLRNDVDRILSTAHVFVLSSEWEGFPRSIIEAMRAGLPVLASNVSGIPESVEHGCTGYLVDRNIEAWRHYLTELISSPDARSRMGSMGRRRFEERFLLDHMANRVLEIYQAVVRA